MYRLILGWDIIRSNTVYFIVQILAKYKYMHYICAILFPVAPDFHQAIGFLFFMDRTFIFINLISCIIVLACMVTFGGIKSLGVSELLHYQGTINLEARTDARLTTTPPMFYDRLLPAGFILFLIFFQFVFYYLSLF